MTTHHNITFELLFQRSSSIISGPWVSLWLVLAVN